MNLKTESNQKESTPSEIKKHEQIAGVIECLNGNGDPFYGAAQNMATSAEIPTINGHLSARKYTTERVEQFMRKGLHFQEVCL